MSSDKKFIVAVLPEGDDIVETRIVHGSWRNVVRMDSPTPWNCEIPTSVERNESASAHRFIICIGDRQMFAVDGDIASASLVVSALGRYAEITRCSMRMAMSREKINNVDEISEGIRLLRFHRWMTKLGQTLLSIGIRPSMGSVADTDARAARMSTFCSVGPGNHKEVN